MKNQQFLYVFNGGDGPIFSVVNVFIKNTKVAVLNSIISIVHTDSSVPI